MIFRQSIDLALFALTVREEDGETGDRAKPLEQLTEANLLPCYKDSKHLKIYRFTVFCKNEYVIDDFGMQPIKLLFIHRKTVV